MHVTVAVLSSLKSRIEYLIAHSTVEDDLKDRTIQPLLSGLDFIVQTYSSSKSDDDDDDDDVTSKQILELAYDIENAIESLPVEKANALSQLGKIKLFFKRSSAMSDLNSLKTRMDTLVSKITARHGEETREETVDLLRPADIESSTFDQFEDTNAARIVIGMEEDVHKVVSLLTNDRGVFTIFFVIYICGNFGGLGKLIYNHPRVVKHFERRAWLSDFDYDSTGKKFKLSPTLSREEVMCMRIWLLKRELSRAREGRKRCLIVLDDIPNIDKVEIDFPADCGTRIFITTTRCCSDDFDTRQLTGRKYYMKSLPIEEGRTPLSTHLLGLYQHQDTRLETIGKHILKACGGLPLAFDVVSCRLRGNDLEQWEEVRNQMQQQDENEVVRVLELSYNRLPYHLKPCFLYLGLLRHEQVIPVEELYSLWMAEGLIIPIKNDDNNKQGMDVAEDYLKQLIDTNLVVAQSDKESGIERFKSCQVHNLAQDMCVSMGKKESFIQAIDAVETEEINPLMRRFAIYLNHKDVVRVGSLRIKMPKRVRTLLFFDTDEKPQNSTWPGGVDNLKAFHRTRVLGFDGVDFRWKKLPKGIKKLHYIRHLSFRGCYLAELPHSVGNLIYLETLDLSVTKTCRMTIPNVLRKIASLKHLYFPTEFQTDTEDHKLRLDGLINLEILENFDSRVCEVEDLMKLEKIRILSAIVEASVHKDLIKMIQFLDGNSSLHQLSLDIKHFCWTYPEERDSLFKHLWNYRALHAFHIQGPMEKLPMDLSMSSNVQDIVLETFQLEKEGPMLILGGLQNLRSLVLCIDAVVDTSILCQKSSFPCLRRLELVFLRFVKNWVMEEGAMPKLSVLKIERCKRLVMLPRELDIANLSELKIVSMSQRFQDAVRERVQELSVSGPILSFRD